MAQPDWPAPALETNVSKPTEPSTLNRRHVFAGAGVAGAAAVAAALLPRGAKPAAPAAGAAALATQAAGGYQVTEHVLHYYRTTRV